MASVCSRDCFHCPFPDCVLEDDALTAAEYAEARERESLLRTPEKKKLAAKQRAYYEANRDEIAAKQRAYREANRDEIAAKQRAYYEANRDEIAAKQRAYREANRDEIAAKGAQVRLLRRTLKMSQTELGRRFGVSQRAVSFWERGEVPFDFAAVIGWLRSQIGGED